MTRLTVQHPSLCDAAVSRFAALAGGQPRWRSDRLAIWQAPETLPATAVDALRRELQVDAHLLRNPPALTAFRVMALDMDSTVITIECIDEIADYAGRKAEVAAITAAAMRGEITDYEDSLRRRVALLQGVPLTALQAVYDERLELTSGVQTLLDSARAAGLHTMLVSGGFTFFTDRLRERLGFHETRSTALEVRDGRLTGRVSGRIVGPETKREAVAAACATLGCAPGAAIAIGDGANDLPMMALAGLSVAFHAKPRVQQAATHALNHCGLDAVLNLFSGPSPA